MALPHISESEWTIMEELWETSPRTALELTRALEPSCHFAARAGRARRSGAVAESPSGNLAPTLQATFNFKETS
jgi:hypothetical protein